MGDVNLYEIRNALLPEIRDIVLQYSSDYDGEIRDKLLEMMNLRKYQDLLKEMTHENDNEIKNLVVHLAWLKQERDYECALKQKLSSVLIFRPFFHDHDHAARKYTRIVTLIHRATRERNRLWTVHFKTPRIYVNYREVLDDDQYDDFNYEDCGRAPPTKRVYDLQLNIEQINLDQFYWTQLAAYLNEMFIDCGDWIHYGKSFPVRSDWFTHRVKHIIKNTANVDDDEYVDELAEFHTTAILFNYSSGAPTRHF